VSYSPPQVEGISTSNVVKSLDVWGTVFQFASSASAAYPLANLALYVPFSVSEAVTAYEGWVVTGGTAGGNFDIGIYSAAGARLTSSGSTVRGTATITNTTAMANLVLVPNTRYYLAFAADSTNTYFASANAAGLHEAMGVLESTTSFVLPTSPTLTRTTRAYVPYFGLSLWPVAQ